MQSQCNILQTCTIEEMTVQVFFLLVRPPEVNGAFCVRKFLRPMSRGQWEKYASIGVICDSSYVFPCEFGQKHHQFTLKPTKHHIGNNLVSGSVLIIVPASELFILRKVIRRAISLKRASFSSLPRSPRHVTQQSSPGLSRIRNRRKPDSDKKNRPQHISWVTPYCDECRFASAISVQPSCVR